MIGTSGSEMVQEIAVADWRYATTRDGQPSVTMDGESQMPPWLADSWVTPDMVRINSGWTPRLEKTQTLSLSLN